MGINKVIYGGDTLMDLSGDDIRPENVDEGVTFHDATGEKRTGTKTVLSEWTGGEY